MICSRTFPGLALVFLLVFDGAAFAQNKTNKQLLDELESQAGTRARSVPVPSPETLKVPESGDSSSSQGSGSSRALKNLKDEEADRTQRKILEQLK